MEGIVMKKIFVILLITFAFTITNAQMENPLKEGMPNTIKLQNGEVVYDLNGEWDAFYDAGGGWGTYKEMMSVDRVFVGL